MSVRLPNLLGGELKNLREAFELSRDDLAEACGCSVSAIQKAEGVGSKTRVDGLIARGLEQHLLTLRETSLMLALTNAAVWAAEGAVWGGEDHGLPVWHTPVCDLWWREKVHAWTAGFARRRTFLTIDSRARFLCGVVGVSTEDGVLLCDMCTDEFEVSTPSAAWRECARCRASLCGDDMCGRYALDVPTAPDIEPPVICTRCLLQHDRTARSGMDVPGMEPKSVALEREWRVQRPGWREGMAHHLGFLTLIDSAIDESRQRLAAVRRMTRWWGARTPPALEEAADEERRELRALRDLYARVEQFLP